MWISITWQHHMVKNGLVWIICKATVSFNSIHQKNYEKKDLLLCQILNCFSNLFSWGFCYCCQFLFNFSEYCISNTNNYSSISKYHSINIESTAKCSECSEFLLAILQKEFIILFFSLRFIMHQTHFKQQQLRRKVTTKIWYRELKAHF